MIPFYQEVIILSLVYGAIASLAIWIIRAKIKRDKKLLVKTEEEKLEATDDLSNFLNNNSKEQLEKTKKFGKISFITGLIAKVLLIILFIFSAIVNKGKSLINEKHIPSASENLQDTFIFFFSIFIFIALLLALINPIINLHKKFALFLKGSYTKETFKKLLKRSQTCIIIYSIIFVPLSLGTFALFIIPNYIYFFKLKKLKYD